MLPGDSGPADFARSSLQRLESLRIISIRQNSYGSWAKIGKWGESRRHKSLVSGSLWSLAPRHLPIWAHEPFVLARIRGVLRVRSKACELPREGEGVPRRVRDRVGPGHPFLASLDQSVGQVMRAYIRLEIDGVASNGLDRVGASYFA
jgi:hypothetical protein